MLVDLRHLNCLSCCAEVFWTLRVRWWPNMPLLVVMWSPLRRLFEGGKLGPKDFSPKILEWRDLWKVVFVLVSFFQCDIPTSWNVYIFFASLFFFISCRPRTYDENPPHENKVTFNRVSSNGWLHYISMIIQRKKYHPNDSMHPNLWNHNPANIIRNHSDENKIW